MKPSQQHMAGIAVCTHSSHAPGSVWSRQPQLPSACHPKCLTPPLCPCGATRAEFFSILTHVAFVPIIPYFFKAFSQ